MHDIQTPVPAHHPYPFLLSVINNITEKFVEVRCDWLEFDDETNRILEAQYLNVKSVRIDNVKLKVWNEEGKYVLEEKDIEVSFDENMFGVVKKGKKGKDARGYKIMRLDNNDKSYFQEITHNDGKHRTWAVNLTLKAKVPPEDICNYMRHPTQFYTCKRTGQPLEE
jgi:hypothetical protein